MMYQKFGISLPDVHKRRTHIVSNLTIHLDEHNLTCKLEIILKLYVCDIYVSTSF